MMGTTTKYCVEMSDELKAEIEKITNEVYTTRVGAVGAITEMAEKFRLSGFRIEPLAVETIDDPVQ